MKKKLKLKPKTRRRLSLAACELMGNRRLSVHSVGERYGYATLAAFSRIAAVTAFSQGIAAHR